MVSEKGKMVEKFNRINGLPNLALPRRRCYDEF